MMEKKIYLLFVVFLSIILQSRSIDYNRKASKNYDNDYDDDDVFKTNKYDRLNDNHQQLLTARRNRYSPYDSSPNNYRSRSRWSSPYDDRYESNDWSPYGYGLNNILTNFPGSLPPAAFDDGAYLGNGPSCYSLLDPQYPLFSDICGAVPQARYALPNSFGHIERWQIAQVLTAILGPLTPTSANPVCTRSLRLLLCPLLFPPCPTRYQPPPVLPCQPFCRVVKNQCASPSLDLLPCDLLPPTSDLCPINPTPYSSLLSSFSQPLPFNGGLSPVGLPQSPLSSLLAQSALSLSLSQSDLPPSMFSPSPYLSQFTPPSVPSPSPYSPPLTPSGVPSPPPYSSQSTQPGVPSPSPYSSQWTQSGVPSPPPYSSQLAPPGVPSPSYPSQLASPGVPSPSYPSQFTPRGLPSPSPYSSQSTQPGVPSPALSSLFSSSGIPPSAFSSLLSSSGMSPSALSSLLSSSGMSPSALSSLLSSSGMSPSALSSLLSSSGLSLSPINPHVNTDPYMADSLTPILVDFPPVQYTQGYQQRSRYFPVTRSATEKV